MLTKLLTFFGVVILAQGSVLPENRIIGGGPVSIYQHPYQVALLHRNPTTNAYDLACGGAIFRLNIILTAAQCLVKTNVQDWKVAAGSERYEGIEADTREVSRLLVHERYVGVHNDIAMMFLKSHLPVRDTIKPIVLPSQDVDAGTKAYMTGWGAMSGGGSSKVLQGIRTTIVDQVQCVMAYSGHVEITENMLCAGRMGVGGEDFCSRDTGGPLMTDNVLQGIASFTQDCGHPSFPGVYTRVIQYANWIYINSSQLKKH